MTNIVTYTAIVERETSRTWRAFVMRYVDGVIDICVYGAGGYTNKASALRDARIERNINEALDAEAQAKEAAYAGRHEEASALRVKAAGLRSE